MGFTPKKEVMNQMAKAFYDCKLNGGTYLGLNANSMHVSFRKTHAENRTVNCTPRLLPADLIRELHTGKQRVSTAAALQY